MAVFKIEAGQNGETLLQSFKHRLNFLEPGMPSEDLILVNFLFPSQFYAEFIARIFQHMIG